MRALCLLIKYNVFHFENDYHGQKNGVAIGAPLVTDCASQKKSVCEMTTP